MTVHFSERSLVAPALLAWTETPEAAARRGSVLFCHGLGAGKDVQRQELASLAKRGFLAIGIDAVGHGERRYADFDRRFNGAQWGHELLTVVQATAAEIPRIVDAGLEAGLIGERLGLVGVSMGGYIAYAAALLEKRLRAMAVLLGSPDFDEFQAEDSPHRHPEAFYPLALLSQNAGQDHSVPPDAARAFHRRLAPVYAATPERQAYGEFPESGHFMREADWNAAWERSLSWLEIHL